MTILRIALRRWRILLLFVILGLAGGFLYAQHATPIYRAMAVLEMHVRRPKVIDTGAVFDDTGSGRDTDAIFNTRFEKFKSPAMEKLATKEFFKRYPERKAPDSPGSIQPSALALVIRDVKWSKDSDANVVRVSYTCPYPRFSADLVNVLADCAGLLMMDENQAQSDEAVKWLVAQVDEQRGELESVEKKLADVRKKTQIDAIQQRQSVLSQTITAVSAEREKLVSNLTARKTAYDFIASMSTSNTNLDMLPAGLPKGEQLNDLISQWRAAHDAFEQTAGRYTPLHPDYRIAKEKESRARERLEVFIAHTVKDVHNELQLLDKQIQQEDQRIASMKAESVDLDQRYTEGMQRVQRLERARDAADESYKTLLRRKEEARRAADENMAFTQVIFKADTPTRPIKPRKPMVILISLMFSAMGGLLVACIVDVLMDKVESVSDLRSMHLNILGIIPSQKKVDSRGELSTIGLRDKFNPLVEIFADINALLSAGRYSAYSQVLLMGSIMPGEGKTVASCNLAISAALNGTKTLLIDGDLRRPQLTNIFSVEETHPSLLEWIHTNGTSLAVEDLVTHNVIDNLDVITSRPVKDVNPAELLGRGHLKQLLDWARENYDRIIIDSPPMGPVSDAQVWGNHADSLVIVSRLGRSRRRALRHALLRFNDTGLTILGCIANDVPHSLEGMFSGAYGYGYGYGNSYGYSNYHSES